MTACRPLLQQLLLTICALSHFEAQVFDAKKKKIPTRKKKSEKKNDVVFLS